MSADQLHSLLTVIGGVPALPGARCRGRHHLFDERRPDEDTEVAQRRHNQALSLCTACPALTDCRAWFAALRPNQRPYGVTAGQHHQPKRRGTPA